MYGRAFQVVAFFVTFLPGVAFANDPVCQAYWFDRNNIFDRAGYCFSSNLGKAVFDNSDCVSSNVTLSKADKAHVQRIKEAEMNWRCDGNNKVTRFPDEVELMEVRRKLTEPPVRDSFESMCIGFNGSQNIPLYAAPDSTAEVLGYVERGDNITFSHISGRDGWEFSYAVDPNSFRYKALGWHNTDLTNGCDEIAG